MKFKSFIIVAALFVGLSCIGQTNSPVTNAAPVIVAPPAPPAPILVHNAGEAFEAFINYEFPSLPVGTGLLILALIAPILKGNAAYLRKFLPDSWQTNKFGVGLATVAGEINPTVEKLVSQKNEALALKAQKTK